MLATLSRWMHRNLLGMAMLALVSTLIGTASADVAVYTQPPYAAGGQYKSSWYAPDGLDDDQAVWDAFTLASNTAITQVQWRGAYTNYQSGAGIAPVYNFTVAIYPSIGGGFQPDIVGGPLVRYQVGGNASETPAGAAGGVAMYDYHYILPSAFQAAGGTKYWVYIQAWQGLTPQYYWPPDWSLARGTGGDGSHFRRIGGTGGSFASISGDCAFTLMASGAPTFSIDASVLPAGAGSIMGTGAYPSGSTATLTASPNHGYGFARWTENGTQVSTNPNYSFAVTRDRTLVANFVPAYSVITNTSPTYGGAATGDGTYQEGSTVTVRATPNQGFVFAGWTYFGSPISDLATYSFPAAADTTLTANFVNVPGGATFDFDDAPVHTSLPVSLSSNGLGALFTATGSGFSIQPVGSVGLAPAGMSGLYVFPNSVFPADLVVDFSQPVSDFSIMYSPQELACDDSATMRVTAFMNAVQVGTNTATAPVPGTYPTGTLRIAVPAGFNRAIVHYDSRPPTCQDYGVIFLADNLTVTMLCQAAQIAGQPASMTACRDGAADFSVVAGGTGAFTYQWQLETSPNNWIDANDGGLPYNSGTIIASGVHTDLLHLALNTLPGAPAIRFRCVVANACGTATSDAATLSMCRCLACPADFNEDGGIDGADVEAFFLAWERGACESDVNADGGVDGADVESFYIMWEAGGC